MNQKEAQVHLLNQCINNLSLIKRGLSPVTIQIAGSAGISKTSSVYSVAKQLGNILQKRVHVCQLNGAEMVTNIDWLLGHPVLEHSFIIEETQVWVPNVMIPTLPKEAVSLGVSRQGVGIPDKIQTLFEYEYSVLLIDDIGRCQQVVRNSLMELINQRKFGSWELPENCLVFITTNEEEDENSINESIDDAPQASRKRQIVIDSLDIDAWAADWADSRLDPYTVMFAKEYWNKNLAVNLNNNIRQFTLFALSVDTAIKDFISLRDGKESILFQKQEDAVNEIEICGKDLDQSIISLFIVDFLTGFINESTNIEKLYDPETDSSILIEKLKEDKAKENIVLMSLQLKRIFNVAFSSDAEISVKEGKYFADIISSGLFDSVAIKFHIETLKSKDKILRKVLKEDTETYQLIFKCMSYVV